MRRVLLQGLPALLIVLVVSSGGVAMDYGDLEKVLKVMPPNGPFWKYGQIVLGRKSRKAGMAPARFSHWSHRSRYTCRVCHQELGFSMRRGDTGINRSQSLAGMFCAACHNGTIAFTVKDGPQPKCKNCHMENTDALEEQLAEFSASLPLAPFGNGIDWASALKSGSIAPANTLSSSEQLIQFPDKLRQPLKLGTSSPRSDVSFSHEDHFAELDCSSCHPDIFSIKKRSTAAFTMESNMFGSFCGACHMQVAFPMNDCKRCHKTMSSR